VSTVTDQETLECFRENPATIEEPLERYIDEDERLWGLDIFELTVECRRSG
jgi:hypothetical protein